MGGKGVCQSEVYLEIKKGEGRETFIQEHISYPYPYLEGFNMFYLVVTVFLFLILPHHRFAENENKIQVQVEVNISKFTPTSLYIVE